MQGRRNKFKSGTAIRGSGGGTPSGDPRGRAPLWGSGGAFSKMRLEFVQQIDSIIITKLLIKKGFFFPCFKLKSGTANAVPALAVPMALPQWIQHN